MLRLREEPMPWSEVDVVELRRRFIAEWRRERCVAAVARRHGISRKTAYKWLERFAEEGPAGLADRSRARHEQEAATPAAVADAIIAMRRRHTTWGGKKLVARLAQLRPDLRLPSPSTADAIIKRAGLVSPRTCRRRHPRVSREWPRGAAPNEVWCVDYKGEFKLRDGRYCYPLTISDEYSRYLIDCRAFDRISGDDVRGRFEHAFREHGLPIAIRSDNGSPFANIGLCRLSRLSVWWLKLGIRLMRTMPGHPEQNGRHERMHRDLKAQTTRPPERDLRAQQRRFDAFRHEHNHERPHEALDQRQPALHFAPSPRPYPERLPPAEYPSHYEVRRVGSNGTIALFGGIVYLSDALNHELVGAVEVDDDVWAVHFGDLRLGLVDRRTRRLIDAEDLDDADAE
jgi:putative transposase